MSQMGAYPAEKHRTAQRRRACAENLPVRLLVAVSLYILLLGAAHANGIRCSDVNVIVFSASFDDAEEVCKGATEAHRFLELQELKSVGPIEVHVVERLPHSDLSALGVYIDKERRAYLLAFAQLSKKATLFDLPIDKALYRSLAVHEVAHAIAAGNFSIPKPRIEAQEYIVYVATIATMLAAHREKLLQKFPGEGFVTEMQINTSIYLSDPLFFGVQAYRHFLKPGNGKAFIRRILAGQALITGNGL